MSLDPEPSVCLLNSRNAQILVDAADYDLVSRHTWTVSKSRSGTFYAVTTINGKLVKLHRLIAGPAHGFDVDHSDRDGLNNTRRNLRVCSRSENNCNARRRVDNASGLKCVYRHCATGVKQWRSRIKFQGRIYDLGLFATKDEAYAAYLAALPTIHGQFARAA